LILVDTPIWIDHLRRGDAGLTDLLARGAVVTHPLVIVELALGNLRRRALVLGALAELARTVSASDDEVLALIESAGLHAYGIGYVDAHLLASARMTPGTSIWTRDKNFQAAVAACGLAASVNEA
jgi:predicted nucleic acid-binding protein